LTPERFPDVNPSVAVPLEDSEPPLVLSIDIGSSSVRVALFDRTARVVDGSLISQSYAWDSPEPGAAEVHPDKIVELVFEGIDHVLAEIETVTAKISAVTVSTLVSSVLGVDKSLRPVTPAYVYADTRSDEDARSLRQEVIEAEWHDRTGCRIHSSYLPARFRWLARTRPHYATQVRRWMSIGEYFFLRLFGRTRASISVASWTGLLDRRRLVWDEETIRRLPVRMDQLSPLADFSEPLVGLGAPWNQRWPRLADVPWYPAMGDGATANVGSGCTNKRRIAISLGTSAALRVVTEDPIERLPAGLWCYRVDRRRALPGGALTDGGSMYSWLRHVLRLGDDKLVDEELAKLEPDAHGLTILPFLAGERSLGWAVNASGSIHGITSRTSSIQILQAGLEAIALRLAMIYQELVDLIGEADRVVASGGAIARSPVWARMIADSIGKSVFVCSMEQTSARGGAILAVEALGVVDGLDEFTDLPGSTFEPDLRRHERYRAALERQRSLYDALIGPA
jgi:gluconokinase